MFASRWLIGWILIIVLGLVSIHLEHEIFDDLVTVGLVGLLVAMLVFVISSAIAILTERRPPGR
jgi:Co/Zn/Cd efflux system component